MPTTHLPVSWEFLDGTARQVAEVMGEPVPEVVLKEGHLGQQWAVMHQKLPVDPGLLAHLEPDEATFWIAFLLVHLRENRVMKSTGGFPFSKNSRYRQMFPDFLYAFLPGLALATIIPFAVFGLPTVFLPIVILPLMVLASGLMLHFMSRGQRKVMASIFRDTTAITGNEEAGRSLMKKWTVFRWTKRGTKPLRGLGKLMAHYQYWIMTPGY